MIILGASIVFQRAEIFDMMKDLLSEKTIDFEFEMTTTDKTSQFPAMAKDLVEMTFQAAVLCLEERLVVQILKFGKRKNVLIGTSDETYQNVILSKSEDNGPPKKITLLHSLIQNKAIVRFYEDVPSTKERKAFDSSFYVQETDLQKQVKEKKNK